MAFRFRVGIRWPGFQCSTRHRLQPADSRLSPLRFIILIALTGIDLF